METYGDLKKAINAIKLKQKGAQIGNFAVDVALDFIPGISTAKSTFDFIKAAFEKPDTKKTNSWLDKLDVDDEMSAIIDDTVENGFLQMVTKSIEAERDDAPLEQDFNMNQKMVDYLKKEYGGRTVTGIKENDMKTRFQKLAGIREEETPQPVKQDSSVTTISKDLEDQVSSFKNISTKEKMEQLLDALVSKLDPKFKESSQFKQSILSFYKKYK